MLHRVAQVRGGETLAVSAAAGGVGTALLELARLAGAGKVYGIASTAKRSRVEALGGIFVDHRAGDFAATIRAAEPDGVDAAFDAIGGTFLGRMRPLVKRGGWLVPYGFVGTFVNGRISRTAGWGTLARALLYYPLLPDGRHVHFYGITARFRKDPGPFREDLAKLFALLGERKIAPVIAERIPLEEIRRAHELLERGEVQGKIVIVS
jgi:NADPH:quinone reductase-like Zn-dependent oxidoreductase